MRPPITAEAARISSAEISTALQHRVHLAEELPPPDFNPLTATAAQLAALGLPPRPNQETAPRAFAHWRRALTPPLRFVKPQFGWDLEPGRAWRVGSSNAGLEARRVRSPATAPRARRVGLARAAASSVETSDNWSGAYLRATRTNRFVRVQASWIVPNPYPPPPSSAGAPWVDGDYRCSTWIGLDGHDATSLSLPQIGTAQFVVASNGNLQVTTTAWWQWWVRGQRFPPITIDVVPIKPGDLVSCEIVVLGPKQVNLQIKNQSSGDHTSFPVDAPTVTPAPGAPPLDVKVDGLTAEWIVERPTHLESNAFFTLAGYGATVFYGCLAETDPMTGGHDEGLGNAKLIEMTDPDDPDDPGVTVSTPVRESDEAVLVYYRDDGP